MPHSPRNVLLIAVAIWLAPAGAAGAERKTLAAVRARDPVVIDGILSESTWQSPGTQGFVQSDPVDGAPPTEGSTVWVAYDDRSLLIAARLEDSEPGRLIAPLARRDALIDETYGQLQDSDWFEVSLDPYDDRLSGFHFAINPAGSIADATLHADINFDYTWDGVWESASRVDEHGWSVEIRIPFQQLRFANKKEHVWGINFRRTIKRKNEVDTFVWIPKGEQGYVSHFAALTGIRSISSRLRAELLPYAAGRADLSRAEPDTPFGSGLSANAGLDAKVALGSNLILDLSSNPDFGQVEVDPAVVNLTDFETYYVEKRPFFIEGAGIYSFGTGGASSMYTFQKADPTFFYSRRIGRKPQGVVSGPGFIDYPDWTTILGAAKVSGKIGKGWNVGFMNVLTSREEADVDDLGKRTTQTVEPLAYYGILRTQKEWSEGNRGLGLIATTAVRDLDADALRIRLPRQAWSLGLDGWTFLRRDRSWALSGWLGGTWIEGSPEALLRLQKTSQHYFQRPDAEYLHLDENADSLAGAAGRLHLNKETGNVIVNLSLGFVSPGFDSTTLGFQTNGDFTNGHATVGYRWLKPGRVFRYALVTLSLSRSWNFGGDRVENYTQLYAEALLRNYWILSLLHVQIGPTMDGDLTRGGVLMFHPPARNTSASLDSDSRKRLVFGLRWQYSLSESGGITWMAGASLRWKPAPAVNLSLGPSVNFRRSYAQWIANVSDPLMAATSGVRTVLANLELHTVGAALRLNWTFTPRLSLQLYAQPYLAVGAYGTFKELARARSFDFNFYGQGNSTISLDAGRYTVDPDGPGGPAPSFSFADPNFNQKSLRGTLVLRWEYHPGSTLYLVWTRNSSDPSRPGEFDFERDLDDLFSAPADNVFMLKLTYRIQ